MSAANAQMDLPKMQATLQQFSQQQELAGMREEYVSSMQSMDNIIILTNHFN